MMINESLDGGTLGAFNSSPASAIESRLTGPSNESWTIDYEAACNPTYETTGDFLSSPLFHSVVSIMYGVVFLLALTGNGLVCFIVQTSPRMKTVTNYFIVNLAVGEILLTLFCVPFTFVSMLVLRYWPFGAVMCKVVNYSQAVSVLVSAYTLVAISMDRYMAIMHPLKPRLGKTAAKFVVAAVWLGALATAAPIAIVSQLRKPTEWHMNCDALTRRLSDHDTPKKGQVCVAASRLYVQSGIYDKFVEATVKFARGIKIGSPTDPTTQHGPQVDESMMNKVLGYIEKGKKQGAKLLAGGKRVGTTGYYIEPTVFADVTDDMVIAQEEIFGPVQSILKFERLEEVIDRANNTNFGLAAGIFTNNVNNALQFSKHVEAGTVWVNTYMIFAPQLPFGGVKESGLGRESGANCVDEYLEVKTVTTSLPKKF